MRMTAYGYDFHQTMIAKIEAAQRPLRVRELADFAALYGVGVQDLIYPPTASLSETDRKIAEVSASRDEAQVRAAESREQLEVARETVLQAEIAYRAAEAEVAVLKGRLAFLLSERQKLIADDALRPTKDEFEVNRDSFRPPEFSMASNSGSPVVLRILLGARLRQLREAEHLTEENAASAIHSSAYMIDKLETGESGITDRDLDELLTAYRVTDPQRRLSLQAMAHGRKALSWWHAYSDVVPDWFEKYLEFETAAAQIDVYDFQIVPDLLQTADYARSIMMSRRPDIAMNAVKRMTDLRMARQEILDRPNPPRLCVVLDETALRRSIGDWTVLSGQIQHLMKMAERPNVVLQILPLKAGGVSTGVSFTVLRFDVRELNDLVYLEQLESSLYLDTPAHLDSYLEGMSRLRDHAMSRAETVRHLHRVLIGP